MRGRSLALRLAVLLAAVVMVVLLAAGWIVNRAASRTFDETLGPRDEARLQAAVAVVEEALERGERGRPLQLVVQQIARQAGGTVRITDADGSLVAEGGRQPRGGAPTEVLSRELADDVGGGSFELVVASPRVPFVSTFNAALLLIGSVVVAALLIAAAVVANRLTRPLREVAIAAGRLGAGDLTARARGGNDAESAELATAFNGMADRLQRSEGLRRRAASDLAHDLATPATVLESQLQAMIDGVVPADAGQLEKARSAAAGLSGIIGQLGELTQAESAPLQRSPEPVEMGALAAEIIDSLGGLLRTSGVNAEVEAPMQGHAMADRGQVTRALRNVITNAVQHSPRGGTVRVEVLRNGAVEVRVRDEGEGIAAEDRPYVFERFYRADRSRGRTPGSGIGLTVAGELIGANQGSVEIESTGPDGTTFLVSLPRADRP